MPFCILIQENYPNFQGLKLKRIQVRGVYRDCIVIWCELCENNIYVMHALCSFSVSVEFWKFSRNRLAGYT